jgi:signal transduction histidine kinase
VDAGILLELLTQIPFVLIFLVVLRDAVRQPSPPKIRIALFFGALALTTVSGWMVDLLGYERPGWFIALTRILAVALPYLLLRIVADFTEVPRWLMRLAEVLLIAGITVVVLWIELPPAAVLFVVGYFVGFQIYAAVRFVQASRREHGVTGRRMRAAAGGSVFLGAAILIAGAVLVAMDGAILGDVLLRLALLGAGLAYLIAFAPPSLLRRAWQQPELRDFLRQLTELPWLADTAAVLQGIERGAAASFGAERASVLLWDPDREVLWMPASHSSERVSEARPGEFISGRAFAEGRAIFTVDAAADDPENAAVYEAWHARAIMAAPIIAGGRKLGVLSIFGRRAPVFTSDDLDLVQLLADQTAVALESRRLLEEATAIRAREEATRLRDDFLSAAAHDLKTPLTSIIGYAQILELKAEAKPDEPLDLASLRRLSSEAERLGDLVTRLLDAGRAEAGSLLADARHPADLTELAREVCERQKTKRHECVVEADSPVIAEVDAIRVAQVLENLVENGKKYSPDGGRIQVQLWNQPGPNGADELARIAVHDQGIGIPPEDLPHVFERFRRASNLDDRRFAGMGLGLYICRMVAEQHGGRIWVESSVGEGSTFHVELPRTVPPEEEGEE